MDVASHGPALPSFGSTQGGFLIKERAQARREDNALQRSRINLCEGLESCVQARPHPWQPALKQGAAAGAWLDLGVLW